MTLEELLALTTPELVARLDQPVGLAEPVQGGWLAVLELVTSRVGAVDRETLVGLEQDTYRAYDRTLGAAVRAREIDEREAVVRRVNLLVALASASSDEPVGRDLDGQAERLVLASLPLTLEETRARVDGWRTSPVEEIRQLRQVKNLLRPLASIRTNPERRRDALREWIELLPSLP